jgi:hypothetical protein
MLQSGMRAPMGVKVKGPDLETIEAAGSSSSGCSSRCPRAAGGRLRRPHRRQALPGDRPRPRAPSRATACRSGRSGRDRGRHRRPRSPPPSRAASAIPCACATCASCATARGARRHPGPAPDGAQIPLDPAGGDPLRARAAGDQERGHLPGRLRHLRQAAGLRRGRRGRGRQRYLHEQHRLGELACRPASATPSPAATRTRSARRRRWRSCCRWRCSSSS